MFVIGKRPPSPPSLAETLKILRTVTTGTLGHLTDFGYANGLQPLVRPSKAVGPAFTVRLPGIDGTALHQALTLVEPGEFLVIDTSGQRSRAMWGGIVSYAAVCAGVVGVAVDAPIVDWEEIVALKLPVWCAGGTMSTTGRRLGLEGQLQLPVQVGGAVVNPGDVVFADSDGLFFIPAADAAAVAERVATREAREPGIRKRLDQGEKLGDITGAGALLAKQTT